MAEFSPRALSPKQGYLASAHKKEENSATGPSETQSIPGCPEATQEPPQNIETTAVDEMFGVLEVTKPP